MTLRDRKDGDTRVSLIIAGEKKAFLYGIIDAIPGFPLTFGPTYTSSSLQLSEALVSEVKLGRLK